MSAAVVLTIRSTDVTNRNYTSKVQAKFASLLGHNASKHYSIGAKARVRFNPYRRYNQCDKTL